jgi:hypothetical protein
VLRTGTARLVFVILDRTGRSLSGRLHCPKTVLECEDEGGEADGGLRTRGSGDGSGGEGERGGRGSGGGDGGDESRA